MTAFQKVIKYLAIAFAIYLIIMIVGVVFSVFAVIIGLEKWSNSGNQEIIELHNEIYKQIIPSHLKNSTKYIPHITLGKSNNIEDLDSFNHEFKTIVDEISIELIGEHEESIIIKKIKIGGLQ